MKITLALGALVSVAAVAALAVHLSGRSGSGGSADARDSAMPLVSTPAAVAHASPTTDGNGETPSVNGEPRAERETEGLRSLAARLEQLEQCANGVADCALPQTDPRSAELELARRLAQTIDEFTRLSQAGEGDPRVYDPIAQAYVQHSDGHVQEAALKLMATLPPHPQQVTALLAGLENTHDAGIYRMALQEFERHHEPALRRRIDDFLLSTLRTGGHFASQEVASHLLPLLNENNIDAYRKLAEELPPESQKGRALKLTIERFERDRHSG